MNEEQIQVAIAIFEETKLTLERLSLAELCCDETLTGKDHVVQELIDLLREVGA